MVVNRKGIERIKEIYQDRASRAQELKAGGKQVMGYLCIYPVLEMLTALDIVPFRILGQMSEPITKADACLPTIVCPFIRSTLDLGLKGKYDFMDGVVMAHVCDVGEKTSHIWRTYLNPPYYYFLDVPHTTHLAAQEQMKEQIKTLRQTLEDFTGKKITAAKLKQAIDLHNQQRALVRELYDLRKPDPPLISGAETLQTMVALMSIPVAEGNDLLKQVISEVKQRKNKLSKKPRLLIWGSIIDNVALVEMIESAGANVVMDDICVGSRAFFPAVAQTDDPLDGLAYRYLVELKCPRTFREATYGETKKDYIQDLESRFGYIKEYIRDWNVNGVILQAVRYCDIHGYEVPAVRDYLDHIGTPHIYLEHDYSEAALAPLRTRVQAFLELLG
ncbi:MAG: 2-hydroxyacyl-CoA dehydratase family protein [Dehalococcoidales bacterium]|nr:2-hydroxyacyl-CoA dehydratase family protein [Dehalococcoidales bacterium]